MINKVFVRFDKLLCETPRAYLLKIEGNQMWFPSRFCFDFIVNKKLGGNMVIPAWLYVEKFGREPSEDEAAEMIIHHIPIKKEKVISNKIKELMR